MKFLLLGQGLAGTLLGYRLERAGHAVDYVDAPDQTASSQIAAGIINPITGRRFVKSWRIDQLIPEAKLLYTTLENELGLKLWHEMPLIRTLYNRGDLNDWQARSADPGYATYMEDLPDTGKVDTLTAPVFAYAGVRHAARVDVPLLVANYRQRLLAEGRLVQLAFDYATIPGLLDGVYDHVVSCEGWRARYNPYFNYLPHGGNKGEVLIVKTKAPLLDRMFKHRVFLVPLADDTYWIGATSDNTFTDDSPTPSNRIFLADRLAEVLIGTEYEIINHQAAVRPTVRDRRMLLGNHPELDRLHIFNGLGTKGTSLAPLGSKWLVEFLLEGKALPAEVDIRRFAQG